MRLASLFPDSNLVLREFQGDVKGKIFMLIAFDLLAVCTINLYQLKNF